MIVSNGNIWDQKRKYWKNLHFRVYDFLASIQLPEIMSNCASYF